MDFNSPPAPALRIYFIPFLATGHMVPLFELSCMFAARGEHVTIITTHCQAKSLAKSIEKERALGHHMETHPVRFPSKEVGLPDGVENPASAADKDTSFKIHCGIVLMKAEMEHFMQHNPPHCIVSDAFYPWTADFANRLGIPRLLFDGSGIFAACVREAIRAPDSPHQTLTSDKEPFLVHGLPHPITLTLSQLPESVRASNQSTHFMEHLREAELKSHGRLVNSFDELELDYTPHYQKATGIKVWQVGPTRSSEQRMLKNESEEKLMRWLNSKEDKSVVYICFGSASVVCDEQMRELAKGVEASGHCFIWVVPQPHMYADGNAWLEENGIKGMIVRGWAPQVMILNHPATGGFITHCGWNSVMEGVCAGVPMITWPLTSEQFYNEKLITQVHGIGVEVGSEEWTRDTGKKQLVSRDSVEKAVRRLMDGGDETLQIRKRAREMAQKSKAAAEEGGSSHTNLLAFIEHLKRLTRSRTL